MRKQPDLQNRRSSAGHGNDWSAASGRIRSSLWSIKAIAAAALAIVGAMPLGSAGADAARYSDRLFDAHLHLNWENGFKMPVDQVASLMRANGVTAILATSRPNDGTHALVQAQPRGLRVVPFLRPYRVRDDVQRWFADATVPDFIEQEFRRGYYVGIGEFHLSGEAAASEVVKRTVEFARQHRLWLHAHVDDAALEILYGHDPSARII